MALVSVAPASCYTPHLTVNRSSIFGTFKRKVLPQNITHHPRQQQQQPALVPKSDMGHKQSKQVSRGTPSPSVPRSMNTSTYPQSSAPLPKKGVDVVVAPPAYTAAPAPNTCSPAHVTTSIANPDTDDPYAFLSSFDTVFLIDDSGSMAGRSWRETKDALETIIPVCVEHDADGIDIYFLNARDSPYHHNVTSPATVREIFSSVQPRGSTPTGQRIAAILKPYLRRCEQILDSVKPLNLIVITDGVPTDDVESAIILAAKKLDKLEAPAWQIGIQFFQVGNDEGAKAHLRQLDDELSEISGGEVRDMVDTVPFLSSSGGSLTGEGILKVVLGAVNRRLDRKKNDMLRKRV